MTALGHHIVTLNSYKATHELLNLRGAIYNSRPHLTWLGELVGWHNGITFMPYSQQWRTHRQAFTRYLSKTGVREYYPLIEELSHLHVSRILKHPRDLLVELRLYVKTYTNIIYILVDWNYHHQAQYQAYSRCWV